MKITRRDSLKYAALASGAALGAPFCKSGMAAGNTVDSGGRKRCVFFLIGNGLEPTHVRPIGLEKIGDPRKRVDVELAPHKLPDHSQPMEKYKDRMTILQGINGRHCRPMHGAPFGCLAGVEKSGSPTAQTIDFALSKVLPQTPLPMLGVGLGLLRTAKSMAMNYTSSAAGNGKPVPMFCDPRMLFQNIFGCVTEGKSQDAFAAETDWYARLIEKSDRIRRRLSGAEADKFDTYMEGLRQTKRQREALVARKEALTKFRPEYTEAFDNPQYDGDWWEANIDIGVAALQAGVTNVLTIDAGLSGPNDMPMESLRRLIEAEGGKIQAKTSHDLGHMSQTKTPDWLTMRHYTWQLLERIIDPLAKTPEPGGQGTMLDNTLIVYTSSSAEIQHSRGDRWAHVLIGNLGGRIRSGRYIQYPVWGAGPKTTRPEDGRTINAFWTTLLHAVGSNVDSFNLDKLPAGIDRPGPMEELLV